MARRVRLTNGGTTIVDDADYAFTAQWDWFADSQGYIVRDEYQGQHTSNRRVYLHRELTGALDGEKVDHQNGDVSDNRQSNLRRCSHRQNMANQKARQGTKSKYKGVSRCSESDKWRAYIKVNYETRSLGRFVVEEDAARAYDQAAIRYFGEFARLNFPHERN